ncbi:ATP-dependent Clp protease proteolytic subunit [Escherichia coli]|uniref:ATP-dependent Clp protease proteolytic subunit n=1 Tax=Escherichia coli TaxID=562 RepID=UPI002551D8FB|nr:ATP-dependent Clp protease proteolytic subunit [Escherichia coli]
MASVIAMAGDTVIMPENAFMMIHKPWGFSGGDAEDMRSYADLLDKSNRYCCQPMRRKPEKPPMNCRMLADETWMSGANVWHTDLLTR